MFSKHSQNRNWSDFDAEAAMMETLEAACQRNLAHKSEPIDELPEDLSPFADMFIADILAFISHCASNVKFCTTITFMRPERFRSSSETFFRVANDALSYSIGQAISCGDSAYLVSDEGRERLIDFLIEKVCEDLSDKGFTIAATSAGNNARIFVSWCTDKEAAGYIYHITDYSQIDAIKCGVPASDVFA